MWTKAAAIVLLGVLVFIVALRLLGPGGNSAIANNPVEARNGEPPASPLDAGTSKGSSFTIQVSRFSRFTWPATGALTSYFGVGHPTGIDIGLDPSATSPVLAAGAGVVTVAGGNACCQYGIMIEIDHGDGFTTLYGHLERVLVTPGQRVEQGDWIGIGGSTGESDGKHLHFELHAAGQAVDPLRYLPAQQVRPYSGPSQQIRCPSDSIRLDSGSTVELRFFPEVPADFRLESLSISGRGQFAGVQPPYTLEQTSVGALVAVPVAPVASGQTMLFQMEAKIKQGQADSTVSCRLELDTMTTQANSEATIQRYFLKLTPTATPQPPPTATPPPRALPTETATKAPAISRTPTQQPATPTPRGPQGLKTPTPRPGPQGR